MKWLPFKIKKIPKNFLGIDIGTSSIRLVELSKKGQTFKLENYGEVKTASLQKLPFMRIESDTILLSNQDVAKAIETILKEAGIQTREVNFSIPDFLSFFTSFELPPMTAKEVAQAVKYEARAYIPLPLSQITLDWSVIEGEISNKVKTPLKVLVVAIPNEVVNQYQTIASLCSLQARTLEAEVFALSRSSGRNQSKIIAMVDIGARSTTINILEKGIVKLSHSFNVSGNELTEILSRSLRVSYEKAEQLKKDLGLNATQGEERNVREVLLPFIDSIIAEMKKIFQGFYQQENKVIEKVILSGGTVLMPGLRKYFFEELEKEVEIADPFSGISHPPILEGTLKEMGPVYSIAVGLALKGFE